MKLGSLFDGIGGFPYSGIKFGITPVWASEIEPWPIKVTEKHFPNMKHLGDITQINGGEIEPVDVITFGSPCQDLSVAGKREGLQGARSGLFMDAVRVIRGMREASNGRYPRFAVWENVPGAFSSNKGEDFRAVLEEITEAEITMPRSGKWATAGMVRTERIDIAWRVLDAQYWGVPQRRRRIFLVADFGGQSAAEILFKPESLRRNPAESRKAGQKAARGAGNGAKVTSGVKSYLFENHSQDTRYKGPLKVAQPVTATYGMGGNNQPFVVHKDGGGDRTAAGYIAVTESGKARKEAAATVGDGFKESNCLTPWDVQSRRIHDENGKWPALYGGEGGGHGYVATASYWDGGQISDCLDCSMLAKGQMMPEKRRFPAVLYDMTHTDEAMRPVKEGIAPTLNSRMGTGGNQVPVMLASAVAIDCRNLFGYAVRRLTPLECLRLQGFPDYWLDIEGMSDTQKYKAVGNSVAIPCVDYVMQGIVKAMKGG